MPVSEDEGPEVPAFMVYFLFLHRNFQDWLEMFSGKRYNDAAELTQGLRRKNNKIGEC